MSSIRADLLRRAPRLATPGAALLGGLLLFTPVAWASGEGGAATRAQAEAPQGQEPTRGPGSPVFTEVSVTREAASLLLEFEGGIRRTLELRGGQVRVDGESIGSHAPGDALERSWRSLLGEAVVADHGEVARLLAAWSPPTGLGGSAGEAGVRMAETLATALTPPTRAIAGGMPAGLEGLAPEAERSLLAFLIRHPDRAPDLARLLEDATLEGLEVRISEDLRVEGGERLEGGVLLVDGDLRVEGVLDGSAYILGGTLRIGEAGRILGRARVLGGILQGAESAIEGGMEILDPVEATPVASTRTEIRAEIERGIRDGMRESQGRSTREQRTPSFFRNLLAGIGGLLQTAVTAGLLLALGLGILHFLPRHFEVVARTVAEAPGRSLATGWAALLLSPAAWIIGIVAFAVSIVGIPVLVLWIPLFWPLLAVAVLTGFLAVARNVGAWWVHRRDAYHPQGLDPEQPAARMGIGLVLLLSPFALASLLQVGGGLFGIFRGLSILIGILIAMNVAATGLGAVLLSRAGRDRRWTGFDPDPDFPDEPGLGPDPFEPRQGPPRGPAAGPPPPWAEKGSTASASPPEAGGEVRHGEG